MVAADNNNQPTRFPPLAPKSPSGVDLLAAERKKSSFNVDSMTKFIYPDGWLDRMNNVLAVIEKDPAFDKTMRYYQNRYEGMRQAYAKEKRIRQLSTYVIEPVLCYTNHVLNLSLCVGNMDGMIWIEAWLLFFMMAFHRYEIRILWYMVMGSNGSLWDLF